MCYSSPVNALVEIVDDDQAIQRLREQIEQIRTRWGGAAPAGNPHSSELGYDPVLQTVGTTCRSLFSEDANL
jgi:hypothetical protein